MAEFSIIAGIFFFCLIFLAAYWLLGPIEETGKGFRAAADDGADNTLAELALNLSPETFFMLRLILAFIAFIILFPLHILPALVAAAAGYFAPLFYIKRLRAKRVRLVESQLVDGLELMGNALKSGLTLQQAVELLVKEFPAPLKQEFGLVLSESKLGIDLVEALERMAKRLDSNILAILATGIAITKRCGGDLTEIFENIASTIREQMTIEGKLEAVTAQGRFQGLILSVMPFGLILILWFVDPEHVQTLFGYQIGLFAFSAVVLMVFLAQVWINQLLKLDV